jgi:tetratricopeptide (TPR) repeat protein
MQSNPIENRQIRIFISSTFKDMQAERDHLVTKVFPALRRYCDDRDVSLFELDLRWGISEEESKQGKVVDICLKEIQKATPFFIGLLGERYGWIPSESERALIAENTSVFDDYPWINSELVKGTSITEIEIQEGVLRVKEKVNAYFYFRSPAIESGEDFVEKPGSLSAKKLAGLKARLREQKEYPVKDYDSVEQLGRLVEEDFKSLVDTLFLQGALPPPEKERLEQKAFLKSRIRAYIPQPGLLEKIDAFVEKGRDAVVVTGGSGTGKSALLANWIERRGDRAGEKILYHFIGQSASEGDYRKITDRLIYEIRDLYGIAKDDSGMETPAGESSVREKKQKELQDLLFSAGSADRKETLVVILDGTDKLSDIDNAKLFNWFPAFPKNLRLVFSAPADDKSMAAFELRGYKTIAVEPLSVENRVMLIRDYLKLFGKALQPAQVTRIADDPGNQNPLILRSLLDELRIFGIHEQIDEQIGRYLAAGSEEEFFGLVLQRLEGSYNYGPPASPGGGFVKDILSLLFVSRAGLSETELLDLTAAAPLYWSRLYNGASGNLTTQNGLVVFAHPFVRNAVKSRWMPDEAAETPYRRQIAEYMENARAVLPGRKNDELPHQLYELKEWDRLYGFLADCDVFTYLYGKDKYELGKYWRALAAADSEKYPLKRIADHADNRDPAERGKLFENVGLFILETLSDFLQALFFVRQSAKIKEETLGPDHPDTAGAYCALGINYGLLGDKRNSFDNHTKALKIREAALGEEHPDTVKSYYFLGMAHGFFAGHIMQCLDYTFKTLEIQKKIFGTNHPETAKTYDNLGVLCGSPAIEDHLAGYAYSLKAFKINEKVLGLNHPETAVSLINFSGGCSLIGRGREGLEYALRAVKLCEEIYGKNHYMTGHSYSALGVAYLKTREYQKALEYLHRAYAVCEKNYGVDHRLTIDRKKAVDELSTFINSEIEKEKQRPRLTTRESCLAAVTDNGAALEFVPEEMRTAEICEAAVKDNCLALEFVPDALKTPELCLAAVKRDDLGKSRSPLLYVPEKLLTPELCLVAVTNHCKRLGDVPLHLRTRRMCRIAIHRSNASWAMRYTPYQFKTPGFCLDAVQHDGVAIKWVPFKYQTPELCRIAMEGGLINAFRLMAEEAKTLELCLEAVRQNGDALEYVPEKYKEAAEAALEEYHDL